VGSCDIWDHVLCGIMRYVASYIMWNHVMYVVREIMSYMKLYII